MSAQGLQFEDEPLTPCDGTCGEEYTEDMLREKFKKLKEGGMMPLGVFCEDCYNAAK